MNLSNTGVVFTPTVFILCKKEGPSGGGAEAVHFDIP